MKMVLKLWNVALATVFCTFALTSCDEAQTIDIPGPPIDMTFSYNDLPSATSGDLTMVVESDIIYGTDIANWLASDTANQKYADAVASATIHDAKLEVSGEGTFNYTGVDSVEIRYVKVGETSEFLLCQAIVNDPNSSVLEFSNIKVSKEDAFELIGENIIVRLYAIYDPDTQNCFRTGATYRFTAETTLAVKLMAALGGFSL